VDKHQRIHCSLNLNTETGRLSSRRPNLQNQPALEKDQYKIRDAFVAEAGNTLIVADYGQLELRLLAHITDCKSMLTAFELGGCFHSRTAVGMYKHVKEAVESGQVLLEWDYSKGQPTVPLVKDTFGSERRKAKTLNFSIAYGKTVHGLAQDW
jgi:DNA polymerase-1